MLDVDRQAFYRPLVFSSNLILSFLTSMEMAQLFSLQALVRCSENSSPVEASLYTALLDPLCDSVVGLHWIVLNGSDDAVVTGCTFLYAQ
jgi:hypothetical protein